MTLADLKTITSSSTLSPTDQIRAMMARLYPRGTRGYVLIFTNMESQGQFLYWPENGKFYRRNYEEGALTPTNLVPHVDEEVAELPLSAKHGAWFMTSPIGGGFAPEKTWSTRAAGACVSFPYLILEPDHLLKDRAASILASLPASFCSVVDSGRISPHATAPVYANTKEEFEHIVNGWKPILGAIGFDIAAMMANQLTRLAGIHREESNGLQELLHLASNPASVSITTDGPFSTMQKAGEFVLELVGALNLASKIPILEAKLAKKKPKTALKPKTPNPKPVGTTTIKKNSSAAMDGRWLACASALKMRADAIRAGEINRDAQPSESFIQMVASSVDLPFSDVERIFIKFPAFVGGIGTKRDHDGHWGPLNVDWDKRLVGRSLWIRRLQRTTKLFVEFAFSSHVFPHFGFTAKEARETLRFFWYLCDEIKETPVRALELSLELAVELSGRPADAQVTLMEAGKELQTFEAGVATGLLTLLNEMANRLGGTTKLEAWLDDDLFSIAEQFWGDLAPISDKNISIVRERLIRIRWDNPQTPFTVNELISPELQKELPLLVKPIDRLKMLAIRHTQKRKIPDDLYKDLTSREQSCLKHKILRALIQLHCDKLDAKGGRFSKWNVPEPIVQEINRRRSKTIQNESGKVPIQLAVHKDLVVSNGLITQSIPPVESTDKPNNSESTSKNEIITSETKQVIPTEESKPAELPVSETPAPLAVKVEDRSNSSKDQPGIIQPNETNSRFNTDSNTSETTNDQKPGQSVNDPQNPESGVQKKNKTQKSAKPKLTPEEKLAKREARLVAKAAKAEIRVAKAAEITARKMSRLIKETNVPLFIRCLTPLDVDPGNTHDGSVKGKAVGVVGDWILTTTEGKFERNLGQVLDAIPFKCRMGFTLSEWTTSQTGERRIKALTEEQLNELSLDTSEGRSEDLKRMADLKAHLQEKKKWRPDMRWNQRFTIRFVIPELHRIAIWTLPYHMDPKGLKKAGDTTGGIFQRISESTTLDGRDPVLWKQQQKITASVDEKGRIQFLLGDASQPEAGLVDLIRRGKKKVDQERARGRYFKP